MKKFMLFATMTSAALVGCVNDEKMEMTSEAQKISFDAPVFNTQTRAKVPGEMYKDNRGDNMYNKSEEFVVYAAKHSGNFNGYVWEATHQNLYMNAVKVSYFETWNGWKDLTKDWYWPEDGEYLTFAAYSPAELTGTVTTTNGGFQLTNFEVPATPTQQYDLMFSDFAQNCTSSTISTQGNTYNGVPLQFNHALSSVKFKIQKGQAITGTATLTGIKIAGVQYKGTLNWNADNSAAWTPASDVIANPYVAFAGTTPQTFTTNAEPSQDCDLLLLPQNLSDNATVEISYTLDGTAYTKNIKLKDMQNSSGEVTAWELGKRYTYIISLDAEVIYFAPALDQWTDVDAITINI